MTTNFVMLRCWAGGLVISCLAAGLGCQSEFNRLMLPSGGSLPEGSNPPVVVNGLAGGPPMAGMLVKSLGTRFDQAVAVLPALHDAAVLEAARAAPGGLSVQRAYDVPLTADLLAPRASADGRMVEPVFAVIGPERGKYSEAEVVAMTATEFLALPGPAASSTAQRVVAGDPSRSLLGDRSTLIVLPELSGRYWYRVQAISAEQPDQPIAGERGPWLRLVGSSHHRDGRLIGLRGGFRHSTRPEGAVRASPPSVALSPDSKRVFLLFDGELWELPTDFPRPSEPEPR